MRQRSADIRRRGKFPNTIQIVLGSGITLAAITAFTLNLILNHTALGDSARRAMSNISADARATTTDGENQHANP